MNSQNTLHQKALNDKTLHKKVWHLAWPMILANVATTLIGIVDTAILGHLPNPSFIGGAAVATSLFNILYMSLAFLRMGTTGLIAQYYGEKQWQDLYGALLLSGAVALGIGLSLILLSTSIFELSIPLIGGSANVQTMAHTYADIRVLSSPFVLFNFVALGFLIGVQKSQQALVLLIFSQAINILLDFYLAVYLQWDIKGIAWATVISDVGGSFLGLYFIFRFLSTRLKGWLLSLKLLDKVPRLFSLNRDIFFRTIVLISIFAFITAQSARQGDVILAANSILIQLFFFLANAIDGFANAAESQTGEVLGKHKRKVNPQLSSDISNSFSVALKQGFGFLILSLILLTFLSSPLLNLISSIPSIVYACEQYFLWLPILMICSIVCFILDGVFIGATEGRAMLIAIVSSTVLVFFPSWYFLQGLGMNNHGLWLALCLFMVFRSGLTYFLYQRNNIDNTWANAT